MTAIGATPRGTATAPSDREREMLRLRTVEGLTLREIGERFGIGAERVRQLLNHYFRLKGVPPAVKARREMRRDGDPMT
jgi:DNA-directed RNA polymerase sigma subunit (sigma70/sigma32)